MYLINIKLLYLMGSSFLLILYYSSISIAFDYVFGDTKYSYSTQSQPAKGDSYVDSTYHTTITRVTDSAVDHGGWGTTCGYSTWCPESSDGNYLLFMELDSLSSSRGYGLYTSNFVYVRRITQLEWWNGQDPEPRWDNSGLHPTWIYYRKDKQLRYVDISDNSDHLVRDFSADFPGYGSSYYIYNGEEGCPSWDSRYWVWILKNANSPYNAPLIFTYDKLENRIIATKNISGHEPNNVSMSQSGNYVAVAYEWTGSGGEYDGPHAYTKELTNPIKLCSSIPHSTMLYDKQGNEVYFFMDSDYVSFVRLDNGQKFDLYYQGDMGWDGSNLLHATLGYNKRGWGIISTYSLASEGGNNHWSDNQIFAFELDETKTINSSQKPRIWRISFTQCLPNDSYYYNQPNAQVNYSGTKIWWGANWRNVNGRMEVYQCSLPSTWFEDLGGIPVNDTTPPYTSGHQPPKGATNVQKNTNITLHIKDDISGVNISSVTMIVNGVTVFNGNNPGAYPNTTISGSIFDYIITYNPPVDFNYGQVVNVVVKAQDKSSPANIMPDDVYSFTILVDTVAPVTYGYSPAQNAKNVPVNTDISFRIKDTLAGVDSSSIIMKVNNVTVFNGSNSGDYPNTTLTGTTSDYMLLFHPITSFAYGSTVTVSIDGRDLYSPPNIMPTVTYKFIIQNAPVTYSISGYVRDVDGSGLSGVQLSLSGSTSKSTVSDNNGFYQFTDLATGDYLITASYGEMSFEPSSIGFTSLSSNMTNQNFVRRNKFKINGFILKNDGTGIANANIIWNGGSSGSVLSSNDGSYEISDLPGGKDYTITVTKTGYNFNPSYINITSLNKDISNQNFIGTKKYYIRGYVKDHKGKPIKDATVTISSKQSISLFVGSTGNFSFAKKTDDTGIFEFSELSSEMGICIITVSKEGYIFDPASRSIDNLAYNLEDCNFIGVSPETIQLKEVKVVGSESSKGLINPNEDESANIMYNGGVIGDYECKIYNLSGELIWSDIQKQVDSGTFEWKPKNVEPGTYIVSLKGPDFDRKKKVIIVR